MSKSSDRRLSLLEWFTDSKVLSLEEIMEKYQVSKRTVQGDVEALKGMGYSLAVARSGENKGLFVMQEKEDADINHSYDAMRGIVGDVIILMELQDEYGRKLELTHDELYRKIRGASKNDTRYYGDRFAWYTNAIARLKEARCIREKKVVKNGKKVRTYRLDINAPRFIKALGIEGVGFFDDAADTLSDYKETQDSRVSQILAKLQLHIMGNIESEDSYYHRRERWNDEETALEQIKKCLIRYPYRTKALKISYLNSSGKTIDYSVKVGMLVFSPVTNVLYLMGKILDVDIIKCIPVHRIQAIQELDTKNDIYHSPKYLEMLKYMFVPSDIEVGAAPIDVEVEFISFGNVPSKLVKLVETRQKYGAPAQLIKKDDVLIYKDKIYNIADVQVYLRGFGRACKVIQPDKLRENMIGSAHRTLERYKKEGYEI